MYIARSSIYPAFEFTKKKKLERFIINNYPKRFNVDKFIITKSGKKHKWCKQIWYVRIDI